jgi:hypothetical protein
MNSKEFETKTKRNTTKILLCDVAMVVIASLSIILFV